ncbi:DUF4350 domain-containing protein [Verrucomicrobium sp. BvORR106]|uniref:DUF4350 domain-containing protein n=1 Tax=Verrucomicrobium sp. BvORR106 TaxID=1403819 RepID=UPI00056EA242|nr:DUF4350 domain-containing protein [Verrucomicrobium sp. BvORR106]
MQRNNAVPVVILVLLGCFAVWCLSSIIGRRFSAGNAYPPYSSLRSDPLGSRVLFESLDRLDGVQALRNYRSLDKLEGGPGQTLMLLRLTPAVFASRELNGKDVQAFAARGGRVVITLDGQVGNWQEMENRVDKRRDDNADRREREQWEKRKAELEKMRKEKEKEDEKKKSADDSAGKKSADQRKSEEREEHMAWLMKSRSLKEVLGLTVNQQNFVMTAKGAVKLEKSPELPLKDGELPSWYGRTSLKFEETPEKKPVTDEKKADAAGDKAKDGAKEEEEEDAKPVSTADRWTALAAADGGVMLAVQRIGQGSVVVATDSYFASNEALLKERAPQFLAWLVGPSREVIFDEFHMGTVETPGIMTLSRRLHLQGLFIGGLVLFGLFIWQSSSSLVPAEDVSSKESESVVSGHGATAGLISLLRRGIPRGQLLTRCFEVWEKSARQTGAAASRVAAAAQVMAPVKGIKLPARQVASVYRQLCEVLHTGSRRKQGGA